MARIYSLTVTGFSEITAQRHTEEQINVKHYCELTGITQKPPPERGKVHFREDFFNPLFMNFKSTFVHICLRIQRTPAGNNRTQKNIERKPVLEYEQTKNYVEKARTVLYHTTDQAFVNGHKKNFSKYVFLFNPTKNFKKSTLSRFSS